MIALGMNLGLQLISEPNLLKQGNEAVQSQVTGVLFEGFVWGNSSKL